METDILSRRGITTADHGLVDTPAGKVWRTHVSGDLPDGRGINHNIDIDDEIVKRHGQKRREYEIGLAMDHLETELCSRVAG